MRRRARPSPTAPAPRRAPVRVSGPSTDSVGQPRKPGILGTSPNVGLWPTTPQNAAGIRIEPPPSVPSAIGVAPYATDAPAPPREPPGVRSRRPRVAGQARRRRCRCSRGSRTPGCWSCRRRPRRPPAAGPPGRRRRRGRSPRAPRDPLVAGAPASQMWSLTDTGTPSSGRSVASRPPVGVPGARRAPRSASTTVNALTSPSYAVDACAAPPRRARPRSVSPDADGRRHRPARQQGSCRSRDARAGRPRASSSSASSSASRCSASTSMLRHSTQ